jgi:hypothetical protein
MRAGPPLWLWLALAWPWALPAGEVVSAEISHARGDYVMSLDVVLDANAGAVRRIATDYAHLKELNDAIEESALLNIADGRIKRLLVMRACLLVFCFRARMVEYVDERAGGEIITTIIPDESDFLYGLSRWRIAPAGPDRSRLQMSSTLRPAFWIPPLIGPWLLKQKMLAEAKQTILEIEHRAHAG